MFLSKDKSNRNKKTVQLRLIKRFRLLLLISAVIFIGIGFLLSRPSPTPRTNPKPNELVSSFSQEPIAIDKNLLKNNIRKDKSSPTRIIIPNLNIDLPVKEAKVVNGYWEVFPTGAGWGIGSGLPGEIGNQVIFSHARKGMFLSLREAKIRQIIYVMTKDKWYSYEIMDIKEVLPSQIEVVAPTSDETLTLFTCSGFSDSKRLIVIAKRFDDTINNSSVK